MSELRDLNPGSRGQVSELLPITHQCIFRVLIHERCGKRFHLAMDIGRHLGKELFDLGHGLEAGPVLLDLWRPTAVGLNDHRISLGKARSPIQDRLRAHRPTWGANQAAVNPESDALIARGPCRFRRIHNVGFHGRLPTDEKHLSVNQAFMLRQRHGATVDRYGELGVVNEAACQDPSD